MRWLVLYATASTGTLHSLKLVTYGSLKVELHTTASTGTLRSDGGKYLRMFVLHAAASTGTLHSLKLVTYAT
jgi:hypothetical protein